VAIISISDLGPERSESVLGAENLSPEELALKGGYDLTRGYIKVADSVVLRGTPLYNRLVYGISTPAPAPAPTHAPLFDESV
jgi:hypothetical protein